MEQLIADLQKAELDQFLQEESKLRGYQVTCIVETFSMIASHFLTEIADPETLPKRMFDVCDWDNDGFHNFDEAVRFAAITSGGPLDKESWHAVCQEAEADPEKGLRFQDYAKLMDQGDSDASNDDEHYEKADADHAFTARFEDGDRGLTATANDLSQNYMDMYVRSAPTASVNIFDTIGIFDTKGEKSAREILSQLSAKPVMADDDDPTDDVGEILRELGNVTDLTTLALQSPPEKKRRRRKKKSADTDKPKQKKKEAKERRTTKGLRTARLKTIICRNWQEGTCKFGDSCGFAHGEYEVQTVQDGCPEWGEHGKCANGDSCEFTHNDM